MKKTPDFVEAVAAAVGKKTLLAHYLARSIRISDILDFFKDVAKVVSVQTTVNRKGKPMSSGFVEFASVNEAKKVRLVILKLVYTYSYTSRIAD